MTASVIGLLALAAALSCGLSFWWLGETKVHCLFHGAAVGGICGVLGCFCPQIRIGVAVGFLILFFYLFVIVPKPEGTKGNELAAVSVAGACYGTLWVAARTIWAFSSISVYFRLMLLLLYVAGGMGICGVLSLQFPGKNWSESFFERAPSENKKGGAFVQICVLLPVYGACCLLPAFAELYGVAALFLQTVCFFGGLAFLDLAVFYQKERNTMFAEQQYRKEMQTYMNVIRSQRHDYNFHVQTLHGLFLQKDYTACEMYLKEVLRASVDMNQLLPLADAAVSALIFSFRSKAQQCGIPMEITIENDLSQIATNVYETNKIIGNLLQNAIDECEQLPDLSYGIHLSIIKRGEFCVINVSNRTSVQQPMAVYRVGHSSKKGHEGIGIASIQALAARYGGVVYSRMEQDIIYFIAKIPLRLIKESE